MKNKFKFKSDVILSRFINKAKKVDWTSDEATSCDYNTLLLQTVMKYSKFLL